MRGLERKPIYVVGVILLAAIFQGCATFPQPYQTPPQDVGMNEREKIYDSHYLSKNWLGTLVGGRHSMKFGRPYYRALSSYLESSGDKQSADTIKNAAPFTWVGLAVGLTGLGVGTVLANNNSTDPTPPWIAFGAGIVLEYLIIKLGIRHYSEAAALTFNAYLKRDLGLPMDYEPK